MMDQKKQNLKDELEQIIKELSDPKAITDLKNFQKLSQRHHFLQDVIDKIEKLEDIEKNIQENQSNFAGDDPELFSLAEEETRILTTEKEQLSKELDKLLNGGSDDDITNLIVEIRAGTGGDEASLFVGDLFGMYNKFIGQRGWKMEILSSSQNEVGGFKEIIFEVTGQGCWHDLKFEGGVHRVQRIPQTEKMGRIHTSTATVAILPVAQEEEVHIEAKDLKIDVFRSSGPGGQSVNTTDSAVRMTHIPSGLVVSCQDEKSQQKNKDKALKILSSRLLDKQTKEQQTKESSMRKEMVGTGERSEKIRTYNFPQDRITDHRIKKSWHGMQKILGGDIGQIISELHELEK